MIRLTNRDEYGNAEIIAIGMSMPTVYDGLTFLETNALTAALNRLAAYEDTRMMPEEIKAPAGWISIKDRLPDGECIATDKNGSMIIGHIWFDNVCDEYVCSDDGDCVCGITHWMPLPDSPKEVGE